MSRTLCLVFVLVLVLGACSARADPVTPASDPPTPTPAAAPYRLSHQHALASVRAVSPRGFERVLTCPRRSAMGCELKGTATTRWIAGTQSHGLRLPRGNGLVEFVRTVVTAWPSAARARGYAGRLTRQLERYRGEYDMALRKTSPGRYTPGDRGRGELHRVSLAGWHGTALRRVFHYVFYDLSPSANVLGGRFVLRRGRYVVDIEWQARNQPTDRRLSHLPRRVLRGLG